MQSARRPEVIAAEKEVETAAAEGCQLPANIELRAAKSDYHTCFEAPRAEVDRLRSKVAALRNKLNCCVSRLYGGFPSERKKKQQDINKLRGEESAATQALHLAEAKQKEAEPRVAAAQKRLTAARAAEARCLDARDARDRVAQAETRKRAAEAHLARAEADARVKAPDLSQREHAARQALLDAKSKEKWARQAKETAEMANYRAQSRPVLHAWRERWEQLGVRPSSISRREPFIDLVKRFDKDATAQELLAKYLNDPSDATRAMLVSAYREHRGDKPVPVDHVRTLATWLDAPASEASISAYGAALSEGAAAAQSPQQAHRSLASLDGTPTNASMCRAAWRWARLCEQAHHDLSPQWQREMECREISLKKVDALELACAYDRFRSQPDQSGQSDTLRNQQTFDALLARLFSSTKERARNAKRTEERRCEKRQKASDGSARHMQNPPADEAPDAGTPDTLGARAHSALADELISAGALEGTRIEPKPLAARLWRLLPPETVVRNQPDFTTVGEANAKLAAAQESAVPQQPANGSLCAAPRGVDIAINGGMPLQLV